MFAFQLQLAASVLISYTSVLKNYISRDSNARKEKTYDFIRRDDEEISSRRDMVTCSTFYVMGYGRLISYLQLTVEAGVHNTLEY